MRSLFVLATLAVLTLGATMVPATTAQDAPPGTLAPLGDHVITLAKSAIDDEALVSENLFLANEGTDTFDGELWFDLDPQATFTNAFLADANGTPIAGNGGRLGNDDITATPNDPYLRHVLDLASLGVSFQPDTPYRFVFTYTLPGDDLVLQRGLDYGAAAIKTSLFLPNGLAPSSDQLTFQNIPRSAQYQSMPEGATDMPAGTDITITLTETTIPAVPLGVALSATGTDPVTLRATISGGIEPYTIQWFRDGSHLDENEGAEEFSVPAADAGRYRVRVTDAAAPQGLAESTYGFLTSTAGPTSSENGAAVGQAGGNVWLFAAFGAASGGLIVYGLAASGILGKKPQETRPSSGPNIGAETRPMLELRKRTQMAALKELELAKKKGEVAEGLYLPLKEELKGETVRVMREMEKRESETV